MKRSWLTFLGLVLLASPATVVQAQSGDGCEYSINASNTSTITITYYSGPGGTVTIPTNINGLTVTGIGDTAFFNTTSLTGVTIPDSATSIGDSVFYQCASLASVTIPDSVTSIGYWAFYECASLDNITIPGSVTSVGYQPFYDCTSLTNVTLADGITSICDEMFFNCFALNSVTIPGSVTSIGAGAFSDCSSLTGVMIPRGVTNLGNDAFSYSSLTNVTIPASVTNIGQSTFEGCSSLAGVYFNGIAPTFGYDVFMYAGNVTVYYLPGTIGWSNTFAGRPAALWNPLIQASGANFGVQNNHFGFNITGTNNFTVVVESCTNLASPVWTPLQTVTLNNGSYYFSDPQWRNYPGRFYGLGLP